MKKISTKVKRKKIPRLVYAKQEIRAYERRMLAMGPGTINRGRVRHRMAAKAAGFQLQQEEGGEEYIALESGDALLTEDAE